MHCPYCPKTSGPEFPPFSHELSRSATTATQQVHTKALGYLVGSLALATRVIPTPARGRMLLSYDRVLFLPWVSAWCDSSKVSDFDRLVKLRRVNAEGLRIYTLDSLRSLRLERSFFYAAINFLY